MLDVIAGKPFEKNTRRRWVAEAVGRIAETGVERVVVEVAQGRWELTDAPIDRAHLSRPAATLWFLLLK